MVLDLAGKFIEEETKVKNAGQTKSDVNEQLEEAMEALLVLGYKASELKKIRNFFDGTDDTAENYIKSALKMLMKG